MGTYHLLIIDGHESHNSLQFTKYCKENKIITLCMPPYLSHILQLLDVGCFSSLKTAYGRQVEKLMCNRFNHITKIEFLLAFRDAFDVSITESNIQGSFQGAGLVPFDPDEVLSKLDVQLHTPTPPTTQDTTWQSKTPSNHFEFGSQMKLISDKLGSSPSSLKEGFNQFVKGTLIMAHQMVLWHDQITELEAANEAAT